eukprot:5344485-Pleurochrysis_carterae.AAC.6
MSLNVAWPARSAREASCRAACAERRSGAPRHHPPPPRLRGTGASAARQDASALASRAAPLTPCARTRRLL